MNRDEIHVWSASLDSGSQPTGKPERTLSTDELARAGKFYFERDRQSYVARRGIMRDILATYLETEPSALRFLYNEFGKPSLADLGEARGLSFNLSHSRGLMLLAVARDRDVGADIEFIDSSVSSDEVAKRFFSTNEIAALEALPESSKLRGFFECWARKEAYIKARGMGLSIPLDSFDVSLIQGETVALLGPENSSGASNCKIEQMHVDRRYAAAVAAPGHDWNVALRTWQPGVRRIGV